MGPGLKDQAKGRVMNDERVSVTVDGGIADVRLNRPDKMNAIDAAMFTVLSEAATEVAGLPGLRAVVLPGNGRGFCAGLDIGSVGADGTPTEPP
jgi:enoyl-CoA hydratase/carnithine racemase